MISKELIIDGKPVWFSRHAIARARERQIIFPEQVYAAIRTGKIIRFAKNNMRFVKPHKKGAIICIGEDLGHAIIIRTIERGN